MILLDATYLHSFGGKTIIELVVEKINKSNVLFHILLDSRLKSDIIKKLRNENHTFIRANHKNRRDFYKKNKSVFSSVLCLANVPPPIQHEALTTIFFHNSLLLNTLTHKISFKIRLINFFKFLYIKHYNNKDYSWVVQTSFMNKLLQHNLNINSDKISTYPIFKKEFKSCNTKKNLNNFVYVSSGVSHKNHIRLINAFIKAAIETKNKIKLHLTLNKDELPKMTFPDNLNIEFHGILSEDAINKLYNYNEFAIYPSLVESFGLPLIEATIHGCKVIASDLPYVHEIIEPSLTFDPFSIESMSNAILRAINGDLSETKVLVENKLNSFINFIIKQDVQR